MWWLGQDFDLLVELQSTHRDTRAHTCTHNRKLPPSSNEFMQITNMQIRVVQLSCSVMRFEENTTKKRETYYESISFNLCRQRDSLIPTLTAFPPQCPDFPHSATPFLPPLPSGLKPQVQENANHWVENARWQHSGVFAIGQWTMREFPEPLVVQMKQLDANTRHRSGWEEIMWNNRNLKNNETEQSLS